MDNNLITWQDLAERYNLFLFNKCINLGEGAVYEEWQENHHCDSKDARDHLETCEVKDCPECKKIIEEFGEYPECECEVYQWYLIDLDESDQKYLNEEFDLDIFYSETLEQYILPVYHYGTAWRMLKLKGGYATE